MKSFPKISVWLHIVIVYYWYHNEKWKNYIVNACNNVISTNYKHLLTVTVQ